MTTCWLCFPDDCPQPFTEALEAIARTVPLAQLMDGKIATLRHWAKGRASEAASSRPPVRPNGGFRGLPRKQILAAKEKAKPSTSFFMKPPAGGKVAQDTVIARFRRTALQTIFSRLYDSYSWDRTSLIWNGLSK